MSKVANPSAASNTRHKPPRRRAGKRALRSLKFLRGSSRLDATVTIASTVVTPPRGLAQAPHAGIR
jgi:hypothetical protein